MAQKFFLLPKRSRTGGGCFSFVDLRRFFRVLARAEQPVSCVTEPRKDIPLRVELSVEGSAVDRDVGMGGSQAPYSLRCSNEAQKPDTGGAGSLEGIDRGYGASPGREHGIEDKKVSFGHVTRDLEVVVYRLKGVVVPVEPDVADSGGRDEAKNSFHHPKAGAQNGNEGEFFSAYVPSEGRFEGSDNLDWFDSEIDGGLIRHEHRNLIYELLENLGWSVTIPEDRQLVLNERMPDNSQCRKFSRLFDHDLRFHYVSHPVIVV